ncbi:penicillin-binding protein, beta-lactamase class C [Arthrobacter crystallopoietes BAB-32]|uniref:Penicillin-binding protein, beta-lactamase class C n=2 Tax=Crystallibacter crystallopoietes TaxID=37928 RepID=N1V4N2_9MICC|nr:penicillin-binding protein, beta-lactamase class C [Arthrobacter crystallopoietes BAB-32]
MSIVAAAALLSRVPMTTAAPDFGAVDSYLRQQLETLGIPGAAVVVVDDGRIAHQAAFGKADGSGRPMTVETPVLLASTTKSLTAIAVLQLVEQGRLELDAPVTTYLPWFRVDDPRGADITVRHLLNQSSGLSTATGSGFESQRTQAADTLEPAVRKLAGAQLVGTPGQAFTYSNDNYTVLGLLVETASGQRFGDYLRQQVLAPLDMEHTHTTKAAALADGLATGHTLWFGTWWLPADAPAPTTGMPSTTLYASAQDLSHELIALLDRGRWRGRSILEPSSVGTMFTPAVRVSREQEYAMGWFVRPLVEAASPATEPPADLPVVVEHQGEWGNTHTYQAVVPSSGLGVALVINANDPSSPSRLKAIDTNILRILHGQPPAAPAIQEDWLQRQAWAVSAALLLAELASLATSLFVLFRSRRPRRAPILLLAAAALALDVLLLWLAVAYVPAHFAVPLAVVVSHLPDVAVTLMPALALALLWSLPRTVLLLVTARRRVPR